MDAPQKSLHTIISTDWALTSPLDKKEISFRRRRHKGGDVFSPNAISIYIYPEGAGVRPRNEGRSILTKVIAIDIWQKTSGTADDIDKKDDEQQQIIDEVQRIVKANRHTITNIDFAYLQGENHLPNLADNPPYLRVILNVAVKYNV